MSRLDDALRRSEGQPAVLDLPERSPGSPLDRFAQGDPSEVARLAEAIPEPAIDVADRFREGVERPETRAKTAPAPAGGSLTVRGPYADRLVTGQVPGQLAVEQYRRLAATLHHAQRDRGLRVVMTASAIPGEGKTLTAINLALTLSESYRRRVLLIDADLRRPMIHTVLGIPNTGGLTAVLKSRAEVASAGVIQVTPGLSVLPAGAPEPDPMSGLTSERMRAVIADSVGLYDWIIIDTPPVALLPDANLLAAMVDGIVLVVGAGRTPLAAVQRAIDALGRDRLLGVVLNRVDQRFGSSGYSSEYYYSYAPRI